MACFSAVERTGVNVDKLAAKGWTPEPVEAGQDKKAGRDFRRDGYNIRMAVVGKSCTVLAPVEDYNEVKATLVSLDDALATSDVREIEQGIAFRADHRLVVFIIGPAMTPYAEQSAVRIDVIYSE